MTRNELMAAFARLGELLPEKAQIVLAGGAALILGGYIERGTSDGDVVHSEPPLAELRSAILQVAQEMGLSPHWLNEGVKAFGDVLPEDFSARADRMGTFGNLRVLLLGRVDLILSKFYGGRVVDLEDLAELRPTEEEIEFVLSQLERIARFRPDKALCPMSHDPERLRLAAEWTRVGGGFSVAPAKYPVDLEQLVGRTAVKARSDYRALAVAISWLAQNHELVNVRRLGKAADTLQPLPSAILGAMIDAAREANAGAGRLAAAQRRCRPLREPRALFDRTQESPLLRSFAKEGALPVFLRWGLWQDELSLRFDALRPISWILEHCPELRLRALYGPGLEAEVLQVLGRGETTIAAVAREVDASYSATHAAVSRLIGRGSVVALEGQGVALTEPVAQWIDGLESVSRRHRSHRSRLAL